VSSFVCEHCGEEIIDSLQGYITGCPHYPLNNDRVFRRIRKSEKHRIKKMKERKKMYE
jgi:hypothetical protein